jgi:hypothetical protein
VSGAPWHVGINRRNAHVVAMATARPLGRASDATRRSASAWFTVASSTNNLLQCHSSIADSSPAESAPRPDGRQPTINLRLEAYKLSEDWPRAD